MVLGKVGREFGGKSSGILPILSVSALTSVSLIRLALSYNHLQHYSFDRSLNMLTRLRYLNLKGNKLTQLPAVVSCRFRNHRSDFGS